MQISKPKLTWKMVVFPLLGIVGFFLYIYLFHVDILGIFATAKKANPITYSIAILFGLLQVLFFTLSWKVLTDHLSIKMSKSERTYTSGTASSRHHCSSAIHRGEVTRTYLLTGGCGSFGKVVASLYTHRFLGTTINAVALIAGLVLLTFGGNVNPLVFNLIIIVAAVIVVILFLMAILSLEQEWTLKGVNWLTKLAQKISRGKIKMEKLKEEAIEMTTHFHESIKEFRHTPKPSPSHCLYLLVSWFFSLSIPYLVFMSLDHQISISVIIVTSAIFLAVKSIPVGIPFEVGLPEAVMTTLYISMGVPDQWRLPRPF